MKGYSPSAEMFCLLPLAQLRGVDRPALPLSSGWVYQPQGWQGFSPQDWTAQRCGHVMVGPSVPEQTGHGHGHSGRMDGRQLPSPEPPPLSRGLVAHLPPHPLCCLSPGRTGSLCELLLFPVSASSSQRPQRGPGPSPSRGSEPHLHTGLRPPGSDSLGAKMVQVGVWGFLSDFTH